MSPVLENRMGLEDARELADAEEHIGKQRALALFDENILDTFEVGTFKGLSSIHRYLFDPLYDFAGKVRSVDLAKGSFMFAPAVYLANTLSTIDAMPQATFDEIVEKYVEMNIAHPFREGNGRATRIWLDLILKKELGQVVDWSLISKDDYFSAMQRSPVDDLELKHLLKGALTNQVSDREVYMKGIDASFNYEGYSSYKTSDLAY